MIQKLKELLADLEEQKIAAEAGADRYEGITAAGYNGKAIAFEQSANKLHRLIKELESERTSGFVGQRFVIHKTSRLPDEINGSYQGSAWDEAGISDQYMKFYPSKELAQYLADKLNKANPVGFVVSEV